MRSSLGFLLASATIAAPWIVPCAAFGQETSSEQDEIVVTAQKREQAIQDVPAAISAIGAETLEQRGIDDVASLQFAAPSIQVGRMPVLDGTAITIRGVGLNEGSPGVAVHVDGVYQSRPAFADLAQLDLQRVEVLRGPQGTLYGRNANGGVVNFISRAPEPEFGGRLIAGYAEYDETHLQAVLNAPLSASVRTRVVVDYRNRGEGFVENVAGGEDLDAMETLSGRFAISMDLSSDVMLDLNVAAMHAEGPVSYLQLNSPPSASAVAANPWLAGASYSFEPWTTTANDPSTSDRDYALVTAGLTWDLGFAQFRSISGYSTFDDFFQTDADGSDLSAFPQTNNAEAQTFTQEFNLSGSGEIMDWVTGLYYLNDSGSGDLFYDFQLGIFPLPPGSYLFFDNPVRDSEVVAVFGDATWHATANLDVIAGARYSREEQRYVYANEAGVLIGGVRFPFLALCPLSDERPEFESFTPRAGLQYRFDEDRNVYATVSRGFKAGGVNTDACANEYNPEELTAYEAGYRSQWLEGALTFNASAFYYDYTDLQLSQIIGLASIITNAAQAEVYGLELEANWTLTEHLRLSANATLLEATYTGYAALDSLDPLAGVQDLSGNYLNNSPRQAFNVSAVYETSPTSFGQFVLRADASYRSRIFFREFNRPLDSQDAYTLVDLGLIWISPSEAFSLRFFANNVTDEPYLARLGSADNVGARFVSYGAPRQVGVELTSRF